MGTQKKQTTCSLLFVSENVMHPFAPLNVKIGDLYITTEGIYFVSYQSFQHSGSLKGAAFFVGGIAGGIAASIGDKDRLSAARDHANEYRERIYALGIQERIEAFPESLSYLVNQVDKLNYSEKESRLKIFLKDDKELDFYAPAFTDDQVSVVSSYPEAKPCYDIESDPHGLFLEYPSPRILTEYLQNGNQQISKELFDKVSQNSKYMFAVYSQIKGLNETELKSVGTNLAGTPENFKNALRIAISKDKSLEGGKLANGIFVLIGGMILSGGMGYYSIQDGFTSGEDWLLILFVAVIGFGIRMIAGAMKGRKIAKEIIGHL